MLRIHKKSLIFILLSLLISGCQAQQGETINNVEEVSTIVITRTADTTVTPIATVEEPVATSTPEKPQIISTSLQPTSIEAYHSGEFVYPVTNPSWSHTGHLIAFSDHDNIWTVNPSNWRETDKVCTTDPFSGSISNLVWSPDDLQYKSPF